MKGGAGTTIWGAAMAWLSSWCTSWLNGWVAFWFRPELPYTLAVIRICCGAMLAYIHIIWASCIADFMGADAWVNQAAIHHLHQDDWGWSYLWNVSNPGVLLGHQVLAVIVSVMMMLGILTRVMVPLAWFLTLMVCHRMTLALFGLDQIVVMLAMYLMVSYCGSVWSLDAWWQKRQGVGEVEGEAKNWLFPSPRAATLNRIATRLIQLHLCVIYIFGGLSKMRGEMWYDGTALWFTIANYEYQSLDLTFLAHWPFVISLLTGVTVFWETFYCALVWPKLTRPIALAFAFFVHGGIAVALGMVTFGFIMIVANFAFVDPRWVGRLGSSSASESTS